MNTETIDKLITLVKDASPILWRAAMRRVWVVAVSDIVWGVLLLIAAYILYVVIKRHWKQWDEDRYDGIGYKIFSIIFCVVLLLAGSLVLTSGLMWVFSPEYAAISFLTDLVK